MVSSSFTKAIFAAAVGASAVNATCTFTWPAAKSDTCQTMADLWGITLAQFIAWNPSVGTNCATGVVVGTSYCVEQDNGANPPVTTSAAVVTTSSTIKTTSTSAVVTTTTSSGSSAPTETQTGVISTCNNWYLVQSNDYCQKIVDSYGTFTLDQFYSWNPAVGTDCSGLWVGYYVCVGVPGTATTKPTTTTAVTTTTSAAATGPTQTQTGVISTCNNWYLVQSNDYCQKIVDSYGTFTLSQFYSWNPAVGTDCSGLWVGYYVCVGVPGTSTTKPTTTTSAVATGPSPTQTGIISTCKTWYQAVSNDYCQKIADAYKITLSQFYSWNPAVGTSCSSLFLGYYYCVGV